MIEEKLNITKLVKTPGVGYVNHDQVRVSCTTNKEQEEELLEKFNINLNAQVSSTLIHQILISIDKAAIKELETIKEELISFDDLILTLKKDSKIIVNKQLMTKLFENKNFLPYFFKAEGNYGGIEPIGKYKTFEILMEPYSDFIEGLEKAYVIFENFIEIYEDAFKIVIDNKIEIIGGIKIIKKDTNKNYKITTV